MRGVVKALPVLLRPGKRLQRRSFLTESYSRGPSEVGPQRYHNTTAVAYEDSLHCMSRLSGNISLPLCLDMVTVQRTLRATLHLLATLIKNMIESSPVISKRDSLTVL